MSDIFNEKRQYWLELRDKLKAAEQKLTEPGTYHGEHYLQLKDMIDYTNKKIGEYSFD